MLISDSVELNFPSIVADSIRVAYFHVHLPVMCNMYAQAPSALLGPDKKPIPRRVLAGSKWVDLEEAIIVQKRINAETGVRHDPRFD